MRNDRPGERVAEAAGPDEHVHRAMLRPLALQNVAWLDVAVGRPAGSVIQLGMTWPSALPPRPREGATQSGRPGS